MSSFENIKHVKFYSINEVAEFLNVNPSNVYRWVASGILQGYKFKGMYRIAHTDILHFIEQSKTRPSTQ